MTSRIVVTFLPCLSAHQVSILKFRCLKLLSAVQVSRVRKEDSSCLTHIIITIPIRVSRRPISGRPVSLSFHIFLSIVFTMQWNLIIWRDHYFKAWEVDRLSQFPDALWNLRIPLSISKIPDTNAAPLIFSLVLKGFMNFPPSVSRNPLRVIFLSFFYPYLT